jgi:hypothetical protein
MEVQDQEARLPVKKALLSFVPSTHPLAQRITEGQRGRLRIFDLSHGGQRQVKPSRLLRMADASSSAMRSCLCLNRKAARLPTSQTISHELRVGFQRLLPLTFKGVTRHLVKLHDSRQSPAMIRPAHVA